MKRIFWKTLLLIGFSAFARAEHLSTPLAETLRSWKVAFVRDGNIWVCNGDGTDQKIIIEGGQRPAWSPDKSQIAFVRRGNIWLAMADGSKQHPVTFQWADSEADRGPGFSDVSISWHPTDGSIAFSHAEAFKTERMRGTAGIVPARNEAGGVIVGCSIFNVHPKGLEPGKAAVRYDIFANGTSFSFANHGHPAWSPSGKKLAFTRNGDIWIAEAESAPAGEPPSGWEAKRLAAVAVFDEPTNRASRQNLGATRLSWHPDGRRLAYGYDRLQGSGFNEVHLLDTLNGKDFLLAKEALEPCFSPDGNFVLCRSYGDACGPDGFCIWAVLMDGKSRTKILSRGTQAVW
jgi:Tol biopolymer transport system component